MILELQRVKEGSCVGCVYGHSFNMFVVPSVREDLFEVTIDGYTVVSEVKFMD